MALKNWFRRTQASDPEPGATAEAAAGTPEAPEAGEVGESPVDADGDAPVLELTELELGPEDAAGEAGISLDPGAEAALEQALADEPALELAPETAPAEDANASTGSSLDPTERRTLVMPTLQDRREEARVRRYAWARYESEEREGEGLVTNLSVVGAMVERASLVPDVGAKLELRLKISGGFRTVDIAAEVIRHAGDGFAIRFAEMDAQARSLVEEVVADAG